MGGAIQLPRSYYDTCQADRGIAPRESNANPWQNRLQVEKLPRLNFRKVEQNSGQRVAGPFLFSKRFGKPPHARIFAATALNPGT
jgi:hypothetical protein